jgi:hypothetical protein
MRRDCGAEHSRSLGAFGTWCQRVNVAKRATEEAGRTDLFGDNANHNGPWRGPQDFVDGKSCFMRQGLAGRHPSDRPDLDAGVSHPEIFASNSTEHFKPVDRQTVLAVENTNGAACALAAMLVKISSIVSPIGFEFSSTLVDF